MNSNRNTVQIFASQKSNIFALYKNCCSSTNTIQSLKICQLLAAAWTSFSRRNKKQNRGTGRRAIISSHDKNLVACVKLLCKYFSHCMNLIQNVVLSSCNVDILLLCVRYKAQNFQLSFVYEICCLIQKRRNLFCTYLQQNSVL